MQRLRVLFASPAYWPAPGFGGPVWVMRELTEGLTRLGHEVEVVTTGLTDLDEPPARATRVAEVGGVTVHYLATPLRYRWMGITPTLPLWLRQRASPDVVHVFGFRDVISTVVAAWCAARRVPYVFEPLGMYFAKLRKLRMKRVFDATVGRHVARGAAAVVAVSEFERRELVAAGVPEAKIEIRPNGFPAPSTQRNGRTNGPPVVLYVGRLGAGKGIELLLEAARGLPDARLVFAGPDGRDGTVEAIRAAQATPELAGRVQLLPPQRDRPLELYANADVFVLPSKHESFGMVAAEAAAAGIPVVVTDRCGVAELLRDRAAVVVPYDAGAIREGVRRVLADDELRARLSAGGRQVAEELAWPNVVRRQEEIYRRVISRA